MRITTWKPARILFTGLLVGAIALNVVPASAGGVSASAKSQIRKLYYDYNQAFRTTEGGIAFIESHNYPGVLQQSSDAWASWKQQWIDSGVKESLNPDLTTVDFDKTWKWVAGPCHPAMKNPPKGTTYIVTIQGHMFDATGAQSTNQSDLHVTIWNGKAYFYQSICLK
jgi:hypothetical protein